MGPTMQLLGSETWLCYASNISQTSHSSCWSHRKLYYYVMYTCILFIHVMFTDSSIEWTSHHQHLVDFRTKESRNHQPWHWLIISVIKCLVVVKKTLHGHVVLLLFGLHWAWKDTGSGNFLTLSSLLCVQWPEANFFNLKWLVHFYCETL